jgi:DNA-binding NtrC family response regulator
MNTKRKTGHIRAQTGAFWAKPGIGKDFSRVQIQLPERGFAWTDPRSMRILENITESVVFAYLVANLNFKNIPLKEFLHGFEKKILLACLRLSNGNQKNAAAVLGLKPTALIEKMHKYGIEGRRTKLHSEQKN